MDESIVAEAEVVLRQSLLDRITKMFHERINGSSLALHDRFQSAFLNRFNDAPRVQLVADQMQMDDPLSFEPLFRNVVRQVTGVRKEDAEAIEQCYQILGFDSRLMLIFVTELFAHQRDIWWGVYSTNSLPLYEFLIDQQSSPDPTLLKEMRHLCRLARSGLAFSFYKHFCLACDHPLEKHLDASGRLHNETGPAIVFADGYRLFSWHGRTVPGWIITSPERITIHHIESAPNIEIRTVLLERFGMARFLAESGASIIHQDQCGVLYSIVLRDELEPFVVVKVVNSTPEPDGTRKEYCLRVPPEITTAHAAVAWTFGLSAEEYNPVIET